MTGQVWPSRLKFRKSAQALTVTFDDGATYTIPYKTLREQSPSAEVRGHGSGPRPPKPVVSPDIDVIKADHVGRYAVRIHFSDGHSSGLYTWNWLATLGREVAGIETDIPA
mgnify:CR=1 FL=1